MGSFYTKFTYRQLLTIKHALLYYMKRENQIDEDWDSEKALLNKVKEHIKNAEEKMGRQGERKILIRCYYCEKECEGFVFEQGNLSIFAHKECALAKVEKDGNLKK